MGGGYVTYTLTSELEQTGGTKVELGNLSEGKYPLNWQSGDKIQVLCEKDGENEIVTFSTESTGSTATFKCTDFPLGYTPLYAIFGGETVTTPSQLPSYSDNPKALSFFIPQEKGPQVDNISGDCFPAVAKIKDNAATFHNVFGLLEVTFSGDETTIKKIVLHDLAGNALWGTCKVPISEDKEGKTVFGPVEVTNTEPGANTISMTLSEAQSLNGASVYFPVPAGALDDGFSIVLYEYDATKTDGVGRAYSFLQKVTGTAAMPRSGILGVTANVTDKHEPLNVNERGFYKSLFVNAGMYLSNFYLAQYTGTDNDVSKNEGIQAISDMGLAGDYEYFASHKTPDLSDSEIYNNDQSIQNGIIIGNVDDANGVLLYPDGSPRFKMVYCNGGRSKDHGPSLTEDGRNRFNTFYNNGGSYSGSCAGSFLASTKVDDVNSYNNTDESLNFTFGIFPGNLKHTWLPPDITKYPDDIYTDMVGLDGLTNALKNYPNKFSSLSERLVAVRHHGGSYLPANQGITNIEYLMKYDYNTKDEEGNVWDDDVNYYRKDNFTLADGSKNLRFWKSDGSKERRYDNTTYSTWAYKKDNSTGRIVCSGSHPEKTNRECDRDYTAFMFQYAMDGTGDARVKENELSLGTARVMGANSTGSYDYSEPERNDAGIGDGQYHHFKFITEQVTENFVLRLDSGYDKNSGIDLYLGLRKDYLAWLSNADYTLCNKGGQKEICIKHLPAGIWYVSVFCATKVEAKATDIFPKYFKYSGHTEVLNGIPYSIMINSGYTGAADGKAPASDYEAGGQIGDDFGTKQFTPNFDN